MGFYTELYKTPLVILCQSISAGLRTADGLLLSTWVYTVVVFKFMCPGSSRTDIISILDDMVCKGLKYDYKELLPP